METKEDNICRVCRSSESTPEDPLFYPCKCSGSMKWVHQSCLENWLKVSQNSKCEICDFEFKFSSIYSSNTPSQLPLSLLVSSLLAKLSYSINRGIRVLVVLTAWTVFAPTGTLVIYDAFNRSIGQTYQSAYDIVARGYKMIVSLEFLNWDNEKLVDFGLKFARIVFRGQLITLGIVFVIVLALALQELVHSTTPEEEMRAFQAQRERDRVNKRLEEISKKTKEELVQEISEILDKNHERQELQDKKKQYMKPSRLPVPSSPQSKHRSQIQGSSQGITAENVMQRMTKTSAEKESHPFLLDSMSKSRSIDTSTDIKGKRKLDFSTENVGFSMEDDKVNGLNTIRLCQTCSDRLLQDEEDQCSKCHFKGLEFQVLDEGSGYPVFEKSHNDFTGNDSIGTSNQEFSLMGVELSSNLMWYYADDVESVSLHTKGPFNWIKMQNLLENKTLTPATMVRRADERHFICLEQLLKDQKPYQPYVFFDYESGQAPIHKDVSQNDSPRSEASNTGSILMDNPVEQRLQPNLDGPQEIVVPNNDAGDQQQAFLNINIGPDLRVEIEAQGEWNSVMELVGLAGPIKNLFNSLLLYYGIIIFGLSIGIALPRTLGHFTLVIMQKFVIPFLISFVGQVSHSLQIVTDPLLDPLVDFLIFSWNLCVSFVVGGLKNADNYLNQSGISYEITLIDAVKSAGRFFGEFAASKVSLKQTIISSEMVQNATSSISTDETIYGIDSLTETSTTVFLGTIFIGYLEMLIYKLQREWASNGLTHPYLKTIGRLLSSLGSGTLLGIKFSFFMVLELVFVPVYCGIFVDYFLLHLFVSPVSFPPRIELLGSHRYVWIFLHWVMGTIFMFQFATYISVIRGTLRKGVFWFIRDPEDPRFQPLNEIIERPFFVHLKKLSFGVFVYTIIMFISVGAYVGLFMGLNTIFGQEEGPLKLVPLRWDIKDAFLEFPIDLVIFHVFGPWILKVSRPQRTFRSAVRKWFQWSAKRFSLTSFLFGGRHPDEESDIQVESILSSTGLPQPSNYRFLRVPNHDHIEVTPGVRDVMIPCRENDPLFGRPHESPEEVRANWTKVYVPKYFKSRLRLLVIWHQTTALIIFGGATLIPLILGRFLSLKAESWLEQHYSVFIPRHLQDRTMLPSGRNDLVCHDIYSFLFGTFVLSAIFFPLRLIVNFIYVSFFRISRKNALRRSNSERGHNLRGYVGILEPEEEIPESLSLTTRIKHGLITWWLVKGKKYVKKTLGFFTLFFWGFLTLPTLFGFAFELYVLHPMGGVPDTRPIYFILNEWGFGILLGKILCSAILVGPDTPMRRELDRIITRGLSFDILSFHRHVIVPIISILSIVILIPKSFDNVLNDLETVEEKQNLTLYLQYFLFFSILGTLIFRAFYKGISSFLESVRDEQFKIGRVLHNYDETGEATNIPPANDAYDNINFD